MEIEQELRRSEIGAALRHHQPRPAVGTVLENAIATENAAVVHGWLVAGRGAAWLTALGDHS